MLACPLARILLLYPTMRIVLVYAAILGACGGSGGGNSDSGGFPDASVLIDARPDSEGQTLGRFAPAASYVVLEGAAMGGGDLEYILGTHQRAFGGPLPVVGDFDGDGFDSVGRYGLVENAFYLRNDNSDGPADVHFDLGSLGSWPVAGDWNGDGVDTVGVYDPTSQHFMLLADNQAEATRDEFDFGPTASVPVAGDFDGDGIDTVAVYEAATATFHLRGHDDSIKADVPPGTLVPFAGDLNGDDIDDLGTVDAETGTIRWQSVDGKEEGVMERPGATLAWFAFTGRFKPSPQLERRNGYDWNTADPTDHGVNAATLATARDHASTLPHLHSMLVVRNGVLLSESYYNDFRPDMPQCIKSVSKSILSALYGIAFDREDLGDPTDTVASYLPDYLPEGSLPRKLAIELRHLLTMSAGLSWTENSFPPEFTISEDPVKVVLDQEAALAPGTKFNYSTGLTHVAAEILTRATGRAVNEYAQEHLFAPLGIEAQRWDHTDNGTSFGGAEVWMTPRDLARFGELYLRRGSIDGKNLVPAAWIDATTATQIANYGGWWWTRTFAGHPVHYAWGYGGQFIFIVPDLDLVVVMTSTWTLKGPALQASYDAKFDLLENWIMPAVGAL